MAMKKTTPAKPLRPGATRTTANPTGLGSRKGTKVTKITGPKTALTKSVVRNPNAPKPAPTSGSVKVMTKSETAIKKGQAKGVNIGSKPAPKKLKKVSTTDKMIERMQTMKGKSFGRGGGMLGGSAGGGRIGQIK